MSPGLMRRRHNQDFGSGGGRRRPFVSQRRPLSLSLSTMSSLPKSDTIASSITSRIALATLNANIYRVHHSVPLEHALSPLEHDLPQPQETALTLQWFETTTLSLRNLIASVDGGEVHVELLEDYYTYISGPALRTYLLRLTGAVSGEVAQVNTLLPISFQASGAQFAS